MTTQLTHTHERANGENARAEDRPGAPLRLAHAGPCRRWCAELVALPANGDDHGWLTRAVGELVAEPSYVHVDRASVQTVGVEAPHVLQELAARDGPRRAACQVSQEIGLALRQLARRAVRACNLTARKINVSAGEVHGLHVDRPLR